MLVLPDEVCVLSYVGSKSSSAHCLQGSGFDQQLTQASPAQRIRHSGYVIQWSSSIVYTLGPGKVSCLERCPHFRGKFTLRKHIWKCPRYRGILVFILGVSFNPLYAKCANMLGKCFSRVYKLL